MTQKWTNQKLFKQIVENLREQGALPDILEYSEPAFFEKEITTYEDECLGSLYLGESKGIYVDVYLEGRTYSIKLGTFRTLKEDYESWCIMAKLMADFQWEFIVFINDHIEDFDVYDACEPQIWEGE